MYPGSLPLIFNGIVPGHEKVFNICRCSMYTGVQFDRYIYIYKQVNLDMTDQCTTDFCT